MRVTRLAIWLLLFAPWVAPWGVAQAQGVYAIDQRFGTIEFTVDHLGMFASHGTFQKFHGELTIDPARPDTTRVTVEVDANSVDMAWKEAVDMLRSSDYFDVAVHPMVRFISTSVTSQGPDRYAVAGMLEMRGVTKPQTLDAYLVGRHPDPANGRDVAEFVVTGKLLRTAFGMVADQPFVSNVIDLRIVARVALALTQAAVPRPGG